MTDQQTSDPIAEKFQAVSIDPFEPKRNLWYYEYISNPTTTTNTNPIESKHDWWNWEYTENWLERYPIIDEIEQVLMTDVTIQERLEYVSKIHHKLAIKINYPCHKNCFICLNEPDIKEPDSD